MRAKPFIVVSTFVLVLGACTTSSTSDPNRGAAAEDGSSPAADVLLLDTDAGPVAVRPATGSVLTAGVGAVADPVCADDGGRRTCARVE